LRLIRRDLRVEVQVETLFLFLSRPSSDDVNYDAGWYFPLQPHVINRKF